MGDKPTLSRAKGAEAVVLPLIGPEVATAEALGLGGESNGSAGPGGAPARPEASSLRLLFTLGFAGALAGALLVFVFLWSDPLIQAENARVLREAVTEVLKGPDHFESVFLLDGELTTQVPEGVDTLDLDKVFLGYDDGRKSRWVCHDQRGLRFPGPHPVIFGYDARARSGSGNEGPRTHAKPQGWETRSKNQPFVGEFDGVDAPIEGVKPDRNTGTPNQVDMITGVTISSRAVVRIINERIAELGTFLAAYDPGGAASAEPPAGSQEEDQ